MLNVTFAIGKNFCIVFKFYGKVGLSKLQFVSTIVNVNTLIKNKEMYGPKCNFGENKFFTKLYHCFRYKINCIQIMFCSIKKINDAKFKTF